MNEGKSESAKAQNGPNYELCCLFDKTKKICGPYVRDRITRHGLVEAQNLNASTKRHIETLLYKQSTETFRWTERSLIENRIKRKLHDSELICEKHRQTHGICWSQIKNCAHHLHLEYEKGSKSPFTKLAPQWLVEKLNKEVEFSFPVGGKCCLKHLKFERDRKNGKVTVEDSFLNETQDGVGKNDSFERDSTYEPDVPFCSPDLQCSSRNLGNQITACLDLSPIPVQVTQTPIRDLSSTMKQTIKRKIEQVKEKVVERIAESVAPTQASELIDVLFGCSDIPDDLKPLIEPFKMSDRRGRLVILSLVDERHSKKVLQNVFGCSKYAVDEARKLQPKIKGLVVPVKEKFHRNKMNIEKSEHFLEFLFSSGLIQDVAYGVSKVKFENGIVQTIPHAVLTASCSHVIYFYLDICKQTDFQPLSESSLWRILRAIKPSKRKSLAGLDDITADGMNAFNHLDEFLRRLKKEKSYRDRLEKGKRYLKLSYQSHCTMESDISSHNTKFALSTKAEESCLQITEAVCSDCYALMKILDEILNIVNKEGTDDDKYDVKSSVDAVLRYMKHQIRDSQQRRAKAYAFSHLNEETAFWLKDFAQKVIPIKYREGQREYFGKKGMSLHIDVFFRQNDDRLLKYVYMTCLFRCKQSMVDVLNIGDNVLRRFKIDCPMIQKLYAKSDNATCYHGNFALEALYKLCLSLGLALLRYDYNEPCKGKDQCDRESAGAKAVMNSFVNSGKDMINANDLYTALHHGKGIRNTQACVLEIDLEKSSVEGSKIKNVSAFHSAQFFKSHMKLHRYFDIGKGVVVKYNTDAKFDPSYTTIRPFTSTQQDVELESCKKQKKRVDHQLCRIIFCRNPLCSDTFESMEKYEQHLLSENHSIIKQVSSMDKVKASYVSQMKVSSQEHSFATSSESIDSNLSLPDALKACPLMKEIAEQGWALPHRAYFQFTDQQRMLLYDIFMEGERTNKKKSPEEVEQMIRKDLDPSQYLTSAQIRTKFSNMAKELKAGTLKPPTSKSAEPTIEAKTDAHPTNSNENETYYIDLAHEVQEVMNEISDWEVGAFVAVRKNNSWYPGKITCVNDDKSVNVMLMVYVDDYRRTNKFRWGNNDAEPFNKDTLMLSIREPSKISSGKRSQYYKLDDDDFGFASESLS